MSVSTEGTVKGEWRCCWGQQSRPETTEGGGAGCSVQRAAGAHMAEVTAVLTPEPAQEPASFISFNGPEQTGLFFPSGSTSPRTLSHLICSVSLLLCRHHRAGLCRCPLAQLPQQAESPPPPPGEGEQHSPLRNPSR